MHLTDRADSRWYVIQAKPKQDTRAESNLIAWGVETFAPKCLEPRRGHLNARSVFRVTPLFPGYLFARFDATALCTKVRLTRGVHRVIGFGECATPLDDVVINAIQERVEIDGLVHLGEAEPGDAVEIVVGPLRSLTGVFDGALTGGNRVRILLSSMACSVTVNVPRAFIRKTTPSPVA